MPNVGHPCPLSPRLPAIELSLPGDWSADAGGDALFLATRADRGDRAPVITAYVHTSREASTDDLVDDLTMVAHGLDEGEADPVFEVDLDGRTWTGLNLSWLEDGVPVYVVHLITALEAGEVTQFVRLTGQVAGDESEHDYDEVQSILETVRVAADGVGE